MEQWNQIYLDSLPYPSSATALTSAGERFFTQAGMRKKRKPHRPKKSPSSFKQKWGRQEIMSYMCYLHKLEKNFRKGWMDEEVTVVCFFHPGWNELLIASFSHRSVTVKDGILLATGLHVHRSSAHSAGVGSIFDRWAAFKDKER